MYEIDLNLLGEDHLKRIKNGELYCIVTFDSADEMADFVEAYRESVDPRLANYWTREYVFEEAYDLDGIMHALTCDRSSNELWYTNDDEVESKRHRTRYHIVPCRDLYVSAEEFEESAFDIASLFN